MKKRLFWTIITLSACLVVCGFINPVQTSPLFANATYWHEVVTDSDDISDGLNIDISGATSACVTEDYIYYVKDGLHAISRATGNTTLLDANVTRVDSAGNLVFALSNGAIYSLSGTNMTQVSSIATNSSVTYFDAYADDDYSYIARVSENTFYFTKLNFDNQAVINKEITLSNAIGDYEISEVLTTVSSGDTSYVTFKDLESNCRTIKFTNSGEALTHDIVTDSQFGNNILLNYLNIGDGYFALISADKNKLNILSRDYSTSYSLTKSSDKIYTLGDIYAPVSVTSDSEFIYITDSDYGAISAFSLTDTLTQASTIVASRGDSIDRYNDISSVYFEDEDNYYVIDRGNNRVKNITGGRANTVVDTSIEMEKIVRSSVGQYTILRKNQSKDTAYLLTLTNQSGQIESNTTQIDIVANSITIDESDQIYLVGENGLYSYSNNSSTLIDGNFKVSGNFVKMFGQETFVGFNGKNVLVSRLVDDVRTTSTYSIDADIIDIGRDMYSNIYILTQDKFSKYSLNDDGITLVTSISLDRPLAHFDIGIMTGEVLFADNVNSTILIYSNSEFLSAPVIDDSYANSDVLSALVDAYSLNSTSGVCRLPYNLGSSSTLAEDTIVYVLDNTSYNNYSEILYYEGSIKVGFVKTSTLTPANIETVGEDRYISNNLTYIYKYPVTGAAKLSTLARDYEINTLSTVQGIDGKLYYKVAFNDGYGYIWEKDFRKVHDTLHPMPITNARILGANSQEIAVYGSDQDTSDILRTLHDGDRVYVASFDKTKPYTKVIISHGNDQIEGYILTQYLKMDSLTSYEWFGLFEILVGTIGLILIGLYIYKHSAIGKLNKKK